MKPTLKKISVIAVAVAGSIAASAVFASANSDDDPNIVVKASGASELAPLKGRNSEVATAGDLAGIRMMVNGARLAPSIGDIADARKFASTEAGMTAVAIPTDDGGFCFSTTGRESLGQSGCVKYFPENGALVLPGVTTEGVTVSGILSEDVTDVEAVTENGDAIDVGMGNSLYSLTTSLDAPPKSLRFNKDGKWIVVELDRQVTAAVERIKTMKTNSEAPILK